MDKSLLVKVLGFPATLVHGDTMVVDRWRWLRRRLPVTANGEKLIDIGCGTGAFTIGAALRGYEALGLSWDERNQSVARQRAELCRAGKASFDVCDVRNLHEREDYSGKFDVAVCTENIEHVLDDFKLVEDIARCLKPGGRLLLTTPYLHFRAVTPSDNGPYRRVEDGGHVRRGYTSAMLDELCQAAGLVCEEVSFCSGGVSQLGSRLLRAGAGMHYLFGWGLVLPLRPLIPLLDPVVTGCLRWPRFSICMEAYKPRRDPAPRRAEASALRGDGARYAANAGRA